MNQQETNNQTVIEDLTVEESRQDEVKGGPLYMKWGQGPEIKGE